MKVVFTRTARKSLQRLPAHRRTQIVARIEAAAAGNAPNIDVRQLAGSDLQRLRVGEYRVLFAIDPEAQILRVELIRTRGDVYKR